MERSPDGQAFEEDSMCLENGGLDDADAITEPWWRFSVTLIQPTFFPRRVGADSQVYVLA